MISSFVLMDINDKLRILALSSRVIDELDTFEIIVCLGFPSNVSEFRRLIRVVREF